jgi:hypothetical protein
MKISVVTLKKEHVDDFAKERNEALKKAGCEWVLFLDSDEVLTPELKAEIDKLKPDSKINGYYIERKGIVEERLLRLARKTAGKWERCVHEIWNVKGGIGYLKNPIIHNEDMSIFGMVKKADFYSTLHAEANLLEGKKSNFFKITASSFVKFIQTFILKKAYKKGTKGFVFSIFQSFQSFLSWTKLYFLSI